MKALTQALFAAQQTLSRKPEGSPEYRRTLDELRRRVPEPVLAHFLRLIAQGRKGVALVTNGICSACHLRVASGIVATLREPREPHLCEHCSCYLLLAPDEFAPPTATVRPKRRRMSAAAL